MSELSHLDQLEAEAIYIIREVAASCEKPVMLYSIGKDSSVMLHLALKAFYPEKPPFPFLHVNTTWKFKEMIKFRDETAKKYGLEMIEYINEDGVKQGVNPFDSGAASSSGPSHTNSISEPHLMQAPMMFNKLLALIFLSSNTIVTSDSNLVTAFAKTPAGLMCNPCSFSMTNFFDTIIVSPSHI